MNTLADKLNEILADEWACVRALRRAEALSDEPGRTEVIKRVRKDCSYHCVTLANIVRALQGRPTDIPSARFSMKLANETFVEVVDLIQSAQQHILDGLTSLIDEPELKNVRPQLLQVIQIQKDDIRWLGTAVKE